MASSKLTKNILFIVEGEHTEPTLLRRINRCIGFDEYAIFAYKTAIYELYQELVKDPYLDILLVLKEGTSSKEERDVLSKRYSAIYLIFDFEAQHHKYSPDACSQMAQFFHDSSNGGKLLMNFPMIEAYRHLSFMPDSTFLHRCVSQEEIRDYKRLVGSKSAYTDLQKYTYPIVSEMIAHHLVKLNYLFRGEATMPSEAIYQELIQRYYPTLIELQAKNVDLNQLQVLSMALFYVIDLKPKTFFQTKLREFSLE